MSSRLDRLFLLLENGGSDATRQAAAYQLGEVVRIHPHELGTLLNRLHSFITSKTWETRIAAGQAVSAIISNIPKWDPQPIKEEVKLEYAGSGETTETVGHLSLESFKIRRVLEKGSYLFSADETQFSLDEEMLKLDCKERAARQRLLVNQRLGLDIADALGINTQNIFSTSDLNCTYSENSQITNKQNSVIDVVEEEMISAGLQMSSRERNRAKRKAKFLNKQKSCNESTDKASEDGPERKRLKTKVESYDSDESETHLTIVDDKNNIKKEDSWPLEEFAENLSHDLFSPSWEVRHGAATALREVVRLQGQGAGKTLSQTATQMRASELSWLEDKALRIICVLALDRFGDFLADQVVAPVRETCAQVLGCLIQCLPERSIFVLLNLLQEMIVWPEWGTRHGGLLGLKYLLAVREDIRKELLKKSFEYIFKGLKDDMDDVVAVAATCLVPVSEDLVECMPFTVINSLLCVLWEALLDIDDLTASTSSILLLISKLLGYQVILDKFVCDLSHLISRLWPFLYHSNASVRTSTLRTIETLLENSFDNRRTEHDKKTEALPCLPNEISSDESEKTSLVDSNNILNKDVNEAANSKENGGKVSENGGKESWLENVLEPLLMHIFQRSLIENVQDNLDLIEKIWNLSLKNSSLSSLLLVACRLMPSWLCLMMTSARAPLDSGQLLFAHHGKDGESSKTNKRSNDLGERVRESESRYYLGGLRDGEEDTQLIEDQVIMARCVTARLLGNLSHYVTQPMPSVEYEPENAPILCYVRLLGTHLASRSGIQRLCAGLVLREWAILHPTTPCHEALQSSLLNCLLETIYFDEISWIFNRVQQEGKDFLGFLKDYNITVDSSFFASPILSLDQIQTLCEMNNWNFAGVEKSIFEMIQAKGKAISKNVALTASEHQKLSVTVQSVIAGALVRFKCLPEKLNPVIKPLMESIKKEANEQLQKMASTDLTILLELCGERQANPSSKIVKNLATFLCVDEDFTPNVLNNSSKDLNKGILSVTNQNKAGNIIRRRNSASGRGPGRPPLKPVPSTSSDSNDSVMESTKDSEEKYKDAIQRRGCTSALRAIASHFGEDLESKLPYLLNMIFEPLENPPVCQDGLEAKQNVINWLQLLEVIIPVLHKKVLGKFDNLAKSFDTWLYNSSSYIRHMSCRVFATLAAASPITFVCHMIENVVPNLDLAGGDSHRMGALECIYLTIEKLGFVIIPYIVLLIVPLLGSMSDPLEKVRLLGAQCFATLIRLFPLDGGTSSPTNISPKLSSQLARERLFLERLLDPTKIEDYKLPIPINAELRSYQQKGVNWLAFLKKFNLHGILCDDMGLGKTLQSICILAGDHYEKEEGFKKKKNLPCSPAKSGCQSLVVCPPTLTGHWFYEVTKFVSKEFLNPLHYSGPPIERKRLRNLFGDHNLIIASYKIVRNEVDYFSKVKWNYIILDEGHTIKNGKTKSSKAIKELVGKHRLILTGTPIQNNVLELWSLFDFLMPGFLGSERQFLAKYSKPIFQSKEAKSSSKEQEDGVLALEALHRQVLPFLLRRIKEDVLKDLPPKITQDYYCDLSPLQERLYEDFAKSRSGQGTENASSEDKKKPFGHIFQALQYLRRVCNHPKLALLPSHPQYEAFSKQIRESKTPLSDISHSAKLPALKQLLLDCGIGVSAAGDSFMASSPVISPHRALIFCQLKGMLDIIEKDLLKVHLPSVTYLRLDGSVQANQRHSLIQRFNSDPSIDLLLLTTQVGGLGLNLTGADTVIFVEHDWNPMRDLQAMDRAHRIGQKRVVNVYRLITRGTLEEKIMSLQKFKMMTANSVITQENSSLLSMGTDQLLELFTLDKTVNDFSSSTTDSGSNESQTLGLPVAGFKKALEGLPALWEEGLYEDEYNFDSFLNTLKQS